MNPYNLNTGDIVKNKNGNDYATVGRINGTGYWVVKSNGKEQRVSYKMVESVKSRLESGQALKFQANGPEGISYTLAIEAGVLHCLRDIVQINTADRTFTLKSTQTLSDLQSELNSTDDVAETLAALEKLVGGLS